MQPSDPQLLLAIRTGLGQLSLASGNDAASTRLIAQIDLAVGELFARSTTRPQSVTQAYAVARRLAIRGAELLAEAGDASTVHASAVLANAVPATVVRAALDLPTPPPMRLVDLEQAYAAARDILVRCVRTLNATLALRASDRGYPADVAEFFAAVAALEAGRAADDYVPAPPATMTVRASFDEARLAAYLLAHGGRFGSLRLLESRTLSGGFSRQTILVMVVDESSTRRALILRKELPGGLLGSSALDLAQELPYLRLTHAAGLPTPEVLAYEEDREILGGAFVILACMPGASLGTSTGASASIDQGLVHQLASILARLHSLDWSGEAKSLCPAAGLPVAESISAGDAARAACAAFETLWRDSDLGPQPTFEIILDWLKRHVPTSTRRAMISHGDVGFHNLMGEDGRLTALLDWETARIADPAKDLAMVRNFITDYVPWERFMEWYGEAGGVPIDEESLTYYRIFFSFAHLLVCEVAIRARFSRAANPDLEYLQLGYPIKAFFAQKMLEICAHIWRRD